MPTAGRLRVRAFPWAAGVGAVARFCEAGLCLSLYGVLTTVASAPW